MISPEKDSFYQNSHDNKAGFKLQEADEMKQPRNKDDVN